MTVNEAIELACVLRPNELERAALERLLFELEVRLSVEVRGEKPSDGVQHLHAVPSGKLAIPAPFDRIYWAYLLSMIDLASGDADGYRITGALFNEARDAYACWYQRTEGGQC